MTASLFDVNVLVALMWPAHEAYPEVQTWFRRNAQRGWATCPLTQAGFVRIVSNPAFSPHAVLPEQALDLLRANLSHPDHLFWADDLPFTQAVEPFRPRLTAHRQVTDAYLLGLAKHKKGRFLTLDRGIPALGGSKLQEHVEVLRVNRG